MRPLTSAEKFVIRQFAEKLRRRECEELLEDMENAIAETAVNDGSRIIFTIEGYERPAYRGQHPFGVEGKVRDHDGADLSVLLHADENGRLLELELVRFNDGDVVEPDWSTLQLNAIN